MKKEYVEELASRLIEQIKENSAPWQKPWKPGVINNSLPRNVISGKPYRGMNLINLMSKAEIKGYEDPRWLTYKQASEKFDAQVRKGEKGTLIHYWKFKEERQKIDEQGNPVVDDKGKPVKEVILLDRPQVFFSVVFNAQQIDGMPPLEKTIKAMEEWERHQLAENILTNSGVPIRHVGGNRAYYSPGQDQITMPERSQFDSSDKYYATALHELGHATGHPSRLNRDLTGSFGSESYAKEELRAEIASMLIGQELQIGHDPSQHVAYLKSWVKVLEDDPKEIFRATRDADKILDYVLELNRQKTIENTQDFLQQVDQLAQTSLKPSLAYDTLQQVAQAENLEIEPLTTKDKLIVKLIIDRATDLSVNVVFDGTGHIALHDLEDKPLISSFATNEDFKTYTSKVIQGIKDTTVTRENSSAIEQDPAVITRLEEEHKTLKAQAKDNPTAFETYHNISKHAQNMGYKAVVTSSEQEIDGEAHQQYNVNYFDANRKTAVTTEIAPGNGKAVTSFRDERTPGTGYTSDKVWQEQSLSSALYRDFIDQVSQTVEQSKDPEANTLLKLAAHKISLFNAKTDYFQFEVGSDFKDQVVSDLKNQSLEDKDFVGIALPFDAQGSHIVVSKSAKEENKFQVTVLDPDNKPISDFGQQSKEAALDTFFNNVNYEETYNRLNEQPKKVYLDVPYHEKQQAKEAGAKWDKKEKSWYVMSDQLNLGHNKWLKKDPTLDEQIQELETVYPDVVVEPQSITLGNHIIQGIKYKGADQATAEAIPLKEATIFGIYSIDQSNLLEWKEDFNNFAQAVEHVKAQQTIQNPDQLEKNYLTVDYKDKEQVKKLGAKWDKKEKSWYVPQGVDPQPFDKWIVASQLATALAPDNARTIIDGENMDSTGQALSQKKTYIQVDYTEKNEAKSLGAKWDNTAKSWYIPPGHDPKPFEKWLPESSQAIRDIQSIAQDELAQTNVIDKEYGINLEPTVSEEKTYIAVAFEDKSEVKELGAKWDAEVKCWYVPEGMDIQSFEKWLPENQPQVASNAHFTNLPDFQVQKDPVEQFAQALREAGLVVDDVKMDGKLHRVKVEGDKGGKVSGAYRGHLDGIVPAGYIQNFKTGLKENWKATGVFQGAVNSARLKAEAAQRKQLEAQKQERLYEEVADKVVALIEKAVPLHEHKYLEGKQVESYGLLAVPSPSPELEAMGVYIGNHYGETKALREKHSNDNDRYKTFLTKGDIMIPCSDQKGKVWTVQTIGENGFKSWLAGGQKHGNFFMLGQPENGKPILAAEGYATGATLHKLTGQPVALAFDSGNLLAVAIAVKQQFDASMIYVAGDNDRAALEAGKMKVNVGLEKALEAAQQVGGHAIIPKIGRGEKISDWNDVAVTKGAEVAKEQLRTALQGIKQEQTKVAEIKKSHTREEEIAPKQKFQSPWATEPKVRHRTL